MRYAILSDIHGNLEAIEAVLESVRGDSVDGYISLGDVVGYGADPSPVIKILQSIKPRFLIAGNHDWGVIGAADISDFNNFAQAAIEWTSKILSDSEKKYLESFELKRVDRNMTLVHGSLEDPERFNYVLDAGDAFITMALLQTQLCFVGHSHSPGFYREDGESIKKIESAFLKLDLGQRYLVNAGSVGQPRDLDPRASYVIYDEEGMSVEVKRVPYDIKKAQDKIIAAGLPPFLAYRLQDGQ
ncbi:MAG TPA: metallophosphoesterase family protein [Candidatus Omnitrophota bacterium]|nr:metallophosphoesterase family protein [Candidatus Omnitrophota bacterium]